MIKIGLLLFLTIIIISCNEPNITPENTGTKYGEYGQDIQELTIEGCQYIGHFRGSNTDWGTHKGNCTNPIHKQNKVTVIDTVEYRLIKQ
jgi:hypothetical protein